MSRFTGLCKCALVLMILLFASAAAAAQEVDESAARVYLHKDWQIQSSCEVKATGEQISALGFDASRWHSPFVLTPQVLI